MGRIIKRPVKVYLVYLTGVSRMAQQQLKLSAQAELLIIKVGLTVESGYLSFVSSREKEKVFSSFITAQIN